MEKVLQFQIFLIREIGGGNEREAGRGEEVERERKREGERERGGWVKKKNPINWIVVN